MTPLELWEAVRDFIQTDQLRGISKMAAMQFTSRLITINPDTKRRVLENKQAFKRRMGAVMPILGKSPDEADAVSLCLQAAIKALGFSQNKIIEVPVVPGFFMEKLRAMQQIERQEAAVESKKTPDFSCNFGTSMEDAALIKLPFT
jgi:hypothetical protein